MENTATINKMYFCSLKKIEKKQKTNKKIIIVLCAHHDRYQETSVCAIKNYTASVEGNNQHE